MTAILRVFPNGILFRPFLIDTTYTRRDSEGIAIYIRAKDEQYVASTNIKQRTLSNEPKNHTGQIIAVSREN